MKRFLTVFTTMLLTLLTAFSIACVTPNQNQNDGAKTLTFYAPDGAPALAIAKFISDNENFEMDATVKYNVVSASNIGGIMQQGKGDFIIMPVNAASKLYNAKPDFTYVMAGVITHGNLYLMSSDGTDNLQALKGKVVGVIGQGLVPDLTFKAILKDNGLLDDVVEGDTATEGKITLRYFKEAPDMLPLMKKGDLNVGLIPEPAATNLTKMANNKTWTRVDVQELYDKQAKAYPQAVLMVKKSVYDAYKTQINGMKQAFDQNLVWVKENVASAVQAVNSRLPDGATPSLSETNINASVVDNCKIYFESASLAKIAVKNYIDKIIAVSAQSAKVINDDFFAE